MLLDVILKKTLKILEIDVLISALKRYLYKKIGVIIPYVQGGSNMTGTDLCVNKPHCAAAVRP